MWFLDQSFCLNVEGTQAGCGDPEAMKTGAKRHLRGGGWVRKESNSCFVAKSSDPFKGSQHKAASHLLQEWPVIYQTHPGNWLLESQCCWLWGAPCPTPPHSRLPTAFAPALSSISRVWRHTGQQSSVGSAGRQIANSPCQCRKAWGMTSQESAVGLPCSGTF